jgi:hypothetical protein
MYVPEVGPFREQPPFKPGWISVGVPPEER